MFGNRGFVVAGTAQRLFNPIEQHRTELTMLLILNFHVA